MGASFEDRQDLLGHKSNRVTTEYSAAELALLIEATNKATKTESRNYFVADAGSCKCLIIGGYGWTRTTDLSIMSAAL